MLSSLNAFDAEDFKKVWDERDNEKDHPQRSTSSKLPRVTAESLTGDQHFRVTGTAPVVRADGTIYLPPGTLFQEKYAVIDVLGEGRMSVVHRARHSVMKNVVAIKLLKGTYASTSKTVLRFQREGHIVSRLNHTNIVRLFDFGLSREGQPFLAMEYLEGKPLSALIKEHGPMPLQKALSIYTQVVAALVSAHASGVIHGDLKPSNIFVLNPGAEQPTVKIVDFAMADIFDEDEDGQKKVTTTGKIFGSPQHMSPEQCLGKKLDDRADVFSVGCLMYEGLTGVPPLAGADFRQTVQKQVQEMPRPFREVAPQRPELARLEPVIFKCLAKEPGSRYQTMAALARALQEVIDVGTASSAPVDNSAALAYEEQERQKGILIRNILVAVPLVIILSGVVAVLLFKNGEVEIPLNSPAAYACFAMDRGQYGEAKKQFDVALTQAKKDNVKEVIVRLLADQGVIAHILADKSGEDKAAHDIAEIAETGGDQLLTDQGNIQAIDALLAGDKSAADLETALQDPVQKTIAITKAMSWTQQYAPAQESTALLIDKLSGKLGSSSLLVVNLKLHYASILLQKIINPVLPLLPKDRQDLISEPKAVLETPLTLCTGSSLWLARSNFALAQALSGSVDEAKKLRDDVLAACKNDTAGADNRGLIEARLADTDMALNDAGAAMQLYKSAYQKFIADKSYAQAIYCVGAFSRSSWQSGQLKERYDFLTGELQKPEAATADAAGVKAELQAWLAEQQYWMASCGDNTLKLFFPNQGDIKKSSSELRREAERLALESCIAIQNSRSSELWLDGPAIDTLAEIYFDGNTVGRSVPLERLKLALAERTNNVRFANQAHNALGAALLRYSKASLAPAYTSYDHSQISLAKGEPLQEAQAIYDEASKSVITGGATNIFWLDQWFPELAVKFIDAATAKVELLSACRTSCENVEDVYGKDSLEYVSQLRWLGHLAWRLGQGKVALKNLGEAHDLVLTNANLPLVERINVFNELIAVCQGTGDTASVKKYTAELTTMTKH